jgi:hypothetical protein
MCAMEVDQASDYSDVDLAALARELNCDLIVGDDTTLLIDLDSDFSRSKFEQNLPIVKQHYGVESIERYPSRNQGTPRLDLCHEHVIIKLQAPLTDTTMRFLLQAALGSDPTRKLLSLYRTKRDHPTPSVLFKPRAKADVETETAARLTADSLDDIF